GRRGRALAFVAPAPLVKRLPALRRRRGRRETVPAAAEASAAEAAGGRAAEGALAPEAAALGAEAALARRALALRVGEVHHEAAAADVGAAQRLDRAL